MARARIRFRPMGLGDILDETFDLYKNNFVLLVGIAAVFYIPIQLISGLVFVPAMYQLQRIQPGAFPTIDWGRLIVAGAGLIIFSLIGYVAVTGALVHAISRRYLDEQTTIGQSYGFIWSRLGAFILAGILVGIVTAGPFLVGIGIGGLVMFASPVAGGILMAVLGIAGIVFMVMASLRLPFATTVLLVEGLPPVEALKRSWRLVDGHVGKIFGTMLVVGLIVSVISSVVTTPVTFATQASAMAGSASALAAQAAVSALVSTLLVPIRSIALILLYYDVRIRQEGFDLQMLARDLAGATGQPLPTAFAQNPGANPQATGPAPAADLKCAYCRFPIYNTAEATSCPSCHAVLHTNCWAERGGCANPDCATASAGGSPQT